MGNARGGTMEKMILNIKVVNPNFNSTKLAIEDCYDQLKLVLGFAESYGMPPVELKLVVVDKAATGPDDYILVSFKTDLISDVYIKVLKDLLHITKGFGLSDCCYQIRPF
jgi:hypothetical protein